MHLLFQGGKSCRGCLKLGDGLLDHELGAFTLRHDADMSTSGSVNVKSLVLAEIVAMLTAPFLVALGKGFLAESPTLLTLAFCILMALNVVFSNVWGIILKEWKGCSQKTIIVLTIGIVVLVISCFLPQLI